MILFTILLITLVVLAILAVLCVAVLGAAGIVVFGDVIVCVGIPCKARRLGWCRTQSI